MEEGWGGKEREGKQFWEWDGFFGGLKHRYGSRANQQGRFQSRGSEAVRRFSKQDRDGVWVGGQAKEY